MHPTVVKPNSIFNVSKYKIKANMGRTIECRLCSLKRNLNNKGFTHRVDGKFTFTEANKKQIIINFFKP